MNKLITTLTNNRYHDSNGSTLARSMTDHALMLIERNEDLSTARRLLEKVLYLHRKHPEPRVYEALGIIAIRKGDMSRALECFQKSAWSSLPDGDDYVLAQVATHLRIGRALISNGHPTTGMEHLFGAKRILNAEFQLSNYHPHDDEDLLTEMHVEVMAWLEHAQHHQQRQKCTGKSSYPVICSVSVGVGSF